MSLKTKKMGLLLIILWFIVCGYSSIKKDYLCILSDEAQKIFDNLSNVGRRPSKELIYKMSMFIHTILSIFAVYLQINQIIKNH